MAVHLVTGGAGFIGSNIAEELLRQGERVRIIDNLATGKRANVEALAGPVESGPPTRAAGSARASVSMPVIWAI